MTTTRRKPPDFTARCLVRPCLLVGLFASCTADRPAAAALQLLQGRWVGFALDKDASTGTYVRSAPPSEITMTISGNSLHFYRDVDFWWETTFTVPEGTDPPQLHATIRRPEDSAGEVVIAFFKLEGETLTLGGIRDPDSTAEWPESFEATVDTMAGRYQLRKVEPAK